MPTAGELKPILTALALPPAAPLLLALLGLVLVWQRRVRWGSALLVGSLAALWLVSCVGFASWLQAALLPLPAPAKPEQLRSVQAIVVLGGGVVPYAPEYVGPQPSAATLGRLRYGAWLAKRTGKPLAFAGGVGWSAVGTDVAPEGQAAVMAAGDFGVQLQWIDSRSRDTAENAREMGRLLHRQGVRRIALVSDAWHLPRAIIEFERAGFQVVPAPTGFSGPALRPLLAWLPSGDGLGQSRQVLREALGLLVTRLQPSS